MRTGNTYTRTQCCLDRGRKMLRLSLLVILLTHQIRTAHVTDRPFTDRFKELYEKLEKLDRYNTVSPDAVDLTEEEDLLLLTAMQLQGMSEEQMDGVVKDLQGLKAERVDDPDQEYGDSSWDDEDDGDYIALNDDWESEDVLADSSSTAKPQLGVTPSAMVIARPSDPSRKVINAAEIITATQARPRILNEGITPAEKTALRRRLFIATGRCQVPQPRWLTVRQLAPAADTTYLPPCVQLHRCTADSGCCINEGEVCAPVEGKAVTIPFYIHKATEPTAKIVKMQFFNHTQCACVSRLALHAIRSRVGKINFDSQEDPERPTRRTSVESQNDWRSPTEEPSLEKDEEATAPPQLRRCTCPALFLASMTDNEPCSCVCEWPDSARRRECQHLAKGKEHFGLRDRVCVARGDCTQPTCEYGAYDRDTGKCPVRRFKRRYHPRRYSEKTMVV